MLWFADATRSTKNCAPGHLPDRNGARRRQRRKSGSSLNCSRFQIHKFTHYQDVHILHPLDLVSQSPTPPPPLPPFYLPKSVKCTAVRSERKSSSENSLHSNVEDNITKEMWDLIISAVWLFRTIKLNWISHRADGTALPATSSLCCPRGRARRNGFAGAKGTKLLYCASCTLLLSSQENDYTRLVLARGNESETVK